MINSINTKKFMHCLRIAIIPGKYEDERIERIKNYCLKYGFSNIMLFINAEEFNIGHMTKEEAAPYVEVIKKAKSVFNKEGLSVSLNPWISIGHLDRGRKLKAGQNFVTMVDMNGKKCDMVACLADTEWKKYYLDFLSYLIKEISPMIIWIEDDFRLHNHGDLEFGGCFCEHHMKMYNEYLNTNYTREDFVSLIFNNGIGGKERCAWFDISGQTMNTLSEEIGSLVRKVSKQTSVGLMSSVAQNHCLEARSWRSVENGLFKNGIKIHRIHLPCYTEINAKEYYYNFNCSSMVIRGFIANDSIIYPELENWAFSTYTKDSRFLRFQIESSIPLIINGMTYDIFDFTGNGTIECFGYGEQIKELTPYLQAVQNLGIRFSDMEGVLVPIDEKTCYHRKIEKSWHDLYPDEFHAIGYLSALGVNYKLSKEKEFIGQTIFLFGGAINYFSDSQLEDLFNNNYIVLDGGAVLNIQQRNLLYLILAKKAELIKFETGVHSYELCSERFEICGIKDYRASAHRSAGDYVKIDYVSSVDIFSKVYSHEHKLIGNGAVKGNNFAVNPYVINNRLVEQFNELRKNNIFNILSYSRSPLIISDYSGISSYLYKKNNGFILILVNATLNSFEKISFTIHKIVPKNIVMIDRDGCISHPHYTYCNGKIIINSYFDFLSTSVFIINRDDD